MTEDTRGPSRQQHKRTKSATPLESSNDNTRPTRPYHVRSKSSKKSESAVSDEATAAFVRRILCSGHQLRSGPAGEGARSTPQPIDEILPPLTSSNDVDLQLYALIAIVIKDFVQTWYSKITPDHEFTDEVVQIIAHCTRGLEQRIRHIDLETLVFDEIPELIDAHVTAYRTAHGGLYTSSLGTNPRELYHAIQPHPALSPIPLTSVATNLAEQAVNESIWRQLLVQAALSLLLPPEDLENPPLRVLVSEILSDLILGKGVCGSICEGWFMWETITKVLVIARPATNLAASAEVVGPTTSRLEKFGLLSDEHLDDLPEPKRSNPLDVLFQAFSQIIKYSTMIFLAVRGFAIALMSSATLADRTPPHGKNLEPNVYEALNPSVQPRPMKGDPASQLNAKRPIFGMYLWSCCSHLLSLDLRMPWLTKTGALMQWLLINGPGMVGRTNGRLDRLLSHHIHASILSPARLPAILLVIRTNLFPNNSLGPGRTPPTAEEAIEIKRACAARIMDNIPEFVRGRLFATQDPVSAAAQIEEMLDVVGDTYLNKHLVFAIVDLVFLRLFPEMERQSISSLLDGGNEME